MAAAQRIDPCFIPAISLTFPRLNGSVIDPRRVLNPVQRTEYIERWRVWCVGKLPHEIPSYINDLFLEESQMQRRYGESASGEWD